jgi:hypothetical protein
MVSNRLVRIHRECVITNELQAIEIDVDLYTLSEESYINPVEQVLYMMSRLGVSLAAVSVEYVKLDEP